MIPSQTGEAPLREVVLPAPAAAHDAETRPIEEVLEVPVRAGSVSGVGDILAANNWTNVFVVTQEEAWSLTGAGHALDPILAGVRTTRFSGFSPNPKLEEALQGVAAFRGSGAQAILAVGGGSAIDMAKLISVLSPQTDPALEILRGEKSIARPAVPVIAVPTTAGTGSEATHFAVVYVGGRKFSLAHPEVLPRYPVVDPDLTSNMPPGLTAVSGLDALSQAIESYWSIHSTELSRALARRALELAWEHLEGAVRASTAEARLAMCRASHLAGRAIQITKTTAPHAISYAITSRFGVPHGHAVAVTLGPLLVFNAGVEAEEIVRFLGCADPEEACAAIRALMARIGCADTLGGLGIHGAENHGFLCDEVNVERLANNPRRLTRPALERILQSIA
jgi:alcohol dehydrogenase class IV